MVDGPYKLRQMMSFNTVCDDKNKTKKVDRKKRSALGTKRSATRQPTEHVYTTWEDVPKEIIEDTETWTLAINMTAFNKILFIVTTLATYTLRLLN